MTLTLMPNEEEKKRVYLHKRPMNYKNYQNTNNVT